jgi:hypothetical protein
MRDCHSKQMFNATRLWCGRLIYFSIGYLSKLCFGRNILVSTQATQVGMSVYILTSLS